MVMTVMADEPHAHARCDDKDAEAESKDDAQLRGLWGAVRTMTHVPQRPPNAAVDGRPPR